MTEHSKFYSGQNTDTRSYALQADLSAFFRALFSSGVIWVPSEYDTFDDPLKVVASAPTSRTVFVAAGAAWVYGYYVESYPSTSVTLDTNSSGNPRIDRIVIRNTISTKTVSIEVLKGTPASSPVPVALTQNSSVYEISLAQILLASGYSTINTTDITGDRQYAVFGNILGSTLIFDTDLFYQGILGKYERQVKNLSDGIGSKDGLTKGQVDAFATEYYPLPSGAIVDFGTASVPASFLICDGSAVSRTTYAAIFAVIGTGFGAGDGSTTFNLPNLIGRITIGHSGTGDYYYVGAVGGETTHTLTIAEIPAHSHAINYVGMAIHPLGAYPPVTSGVGPGVTNTGNAGSGGAHDNMPPYITLNPGIKI